MRVTRVVVPGLDIIAKRVQLSDDRARYVAKVLRLKSGTPITLVDGRGGEFYGVVEIKGRADVFVDINEYRLIDRESALQIELILGVSRGDRMDFAIQKAVELGVYSVTPVVTERGVVKLDERRTVQRQHHWSEIARGACEQCGRNVTPDVHQPTSLRSWLDMRDRNVKGIVLQPMAALSLDELRNDPAANVQVLVGPEGGLTDDEISAAEAAGFTALRLGPRTLRAETAAMAVICALQVVWGDLS